MSDLKPYWMELKLADADEVKRIRDLLWDDLEPGDGYEKAEPHLTIHPGFSGDASCVESVAGIGPYAVGREVRVEGVSFWPHKTKPMVVKLDVSSDGVENTRSAIESTIESADGTIDRESVPLHITLFKSGDAGESPTDLLKSSHRILEGLEGSHGDWSTTVSGFAVHRRY